MYVKTTKPPISATNVKTSAATTAGCLNVSTRSRRLTTGGLSTSGSRKRTPRAATAPRSPTITNDMRQLE